jgi:hypothetical protein
VAGSAENPRKASYKGPGAKSAELNAVAIVGILKRGLQRHAFRRAARIAGAKAWTFPLAISGGLAAKAQTWRPPKSADYCRLYFWAASG